jgi:hypothetical protein
MDATTIAAIVFALVIAGAIAFQLALAAGMPWGAYAMGGRFPGVFPPRMRVAAVVQAVVLLALGGIVLAAAGVGLAGLLDPAPWLVWVAVIFSALSLLVNAISPSPGERRIWVPAAVVLLASSLVVALTAG